MDRVCLFFIHSRQCLLENDTAFLNCFHNQQLSFKLIGHISFLFLGTLIINYDQLPDVVEQDRTQPWRGDKVHHLPNTVEVLRWISECPIHFKMIDIQFLVTDIQPICEIVRRGEETTGHSVRPT